MADLLTSIEINERGDHQNTGDKTILTSIMNKF